MKPRARRITVVAAAIVAAVVAVLASWGTIRDHVEAWHFQLTRETMTMDPRSLNDEGETSPQILATYSNRSVIFDPAQRGWTLWFLNRGKTLTAEFVLLVLRNDGYRLLEQRFPRRAYVLIRDADRPVESSPVLWDGVLPESPGTTEPPVMPEVR